MPPFRQAPHDPTMAARSGVTNYIPQRSQPDLSHKCDECNKTAKWEVLSDLVKLFLCDTHRADHAIDAGTYEEKRL